jgi:hypothetical protein
VSEASDQTRKKGEESFGDSFAGLFHEDGGRVADRQACSNSVNVRCSDCRRPDHRVWKSSLSPSPMRKKATARLTQALEEPNGDATPATRKAMEDLSLQFPKHDAFLDDLAQEMEALFIQSECRARSDGRGLQAAGVSGGGLGIDLEQGRHAVSQALAERDGHFTTGTKPR